MTSLFHHDVAVAVIGSGSRGNCTYVGDGRSGVIIDCGVSTKQVFARLDAIGLPHAPVDAVLITHEHADHVGAARILDDRLARRRGVHVPFYMTRGTHARLNPNVVPTRVERAFAGKVFRVGGVEVEPVMVPHDTPEPVAYVVTFGRARVAVITDLGRSTKVVEQMLSTVDVAVLEFNHDVQMLVEGGYPWQLKQRIRGGHGHLSNDQAAELLERGMSSRLKHVVLAHLSDENNRPEKALAAAHRALHRAGRRDVTLTVGRQDRALDRIAIASPSEPMPARRPPPMRTPTRRTAHVPHEAQGSLF